MKGRRGRQTRDEKRKVDLDAMLDRQPPGFQCFHIEEPRLVFSGGNTAVDPKAGIAAFGPLNTEAFHSKAVRLGVIGTGHGIQCVQNYIQRCLEPVKPGLNKREKHYDALCFPDFPGAQPANGFRAHFSIERTRDIPLAKFERAISGSDVSSKLRSVVELVETQMEMMRAFEPCPDVVIVVLPGCVETACRTVGSSFRARRAPLTAVEKAQRSLAREAARSEQMVFDLEFTESETVERNGF
jgi:hypothetical protein